MGFAAKPLEPKWAVWFSLATPFGVAFVFLANRYLLTPWHVAFAWYGIVAYIVVALSWSSLERESRNAAIRGNNVFVVTAFVLVAIAMFTTREGEPFPKWALIVGIIAAVGGYSVAGVFAVRNFMRWLRGYYKPAVTQRTLD
jgi:hypothetical protein